MEHTTPKAPGLEDSPRLRVKKLQQRCFLIEDDVRNLQEELNDAKETMTRLDEEITRLEDNEYLTSEGLEDALPNCPEFEDLAEKVEKIYKALKKRKYFLT